jgi:hypothetical protein
VSAGSWLRRTLGVAPKRDVRGVVLTYHSINIHGNDYANNDHVALREDLRIVARLGLPILPLHEAVAALQGRVPAPADRFVAFSADDGSWFDWHDLDHPSCGPQLSFRRVLEEFKRESQRPAHLTSFVIVSPEARAELDRTCLVGRGWWGDDWWPQATAGNLIAVESHSWDHNHDTLAQTAQRDGIKGNFHAIETWAEADAELRQASDWLDAHCPARRTSLLAWPYGQSSEYLVREYLPQYRAQHRLDAAFGCEPRPIAADDDPWTYGRYVCGHDWKSPRDLERLLRDALV